MAVRLTASYEYVRKFSIAFDISVDIIYGFLLLCNLTKMKFPFQLDLWLS